jgi:hypothetical protein
VQNSRGSNNLPNVVSREIAPFFQAIPPPVQDVGRKEGEIYTDSTIDFGSHSTSPSSLSSWGDHAPIVGSSATQVMDIRQDSVVIAKSPPEDSDAVLGRIDVFKRKLRAHYIDNPNNHRDSLWLDTRRYPQDYYTDKPLSGPCYSGNARAVYAKASEQREKDYLNGIHQNFTVDSPDVDWIALRQLPALNYTFRSGVFVGKSLTGPRGVPEWYREELMCGGENWLVKTDVALGNEMKRRGYKVRKAQSVLNSRNSPSPAKKRRVAFETSAPTTTPWVIPAQPTQSIVAAPLSPHGKVTLPSLPQILARDRRFDHALMFPRHSGFWRTQRELASPNPVKDIDLDAVLIARNGPMAKFTDGAGGVDKNVDRDVLDKIWNAKLEAHGRVV